MRSLPGPPLVPENPLVSIRLLLLKTMADLGRGGQKHDISPYFNRFSSITNKHFSSYHKHLLNFQNFTKVDFNKFCLLFFLLRKENQSYTL
jgi:hypothetical protein